MKHLGAAVVAVAIAFGVSALAQAAEPPAGKSEKREVEHITGKLTKIDGRALTIEQTIAEGKTEEMVVTCSRGTRVWKTKMEPLYAGEGAEAAGEKEHTRMRPVRIPGDFSDLKVGQEVRVFFHTDDKLAVSVFITGGAPAPTATPKETPKQE